MSVRCALLFVGSVLLLSLCWAIFCPTDYRPFPTGVRTALQLMAIPWQVALVTIRADSIHGTGTLAMILTVLSLEACIFLLLRLLAKRKSGNQSRRRTH